MKRLISILDSVYSKYIRQKYSNSKGYCQCYTCDKPMRWKDAQCGHFVSRAHMSTRWDEKNTYPQCPNCNMLLSGNIPAFEKKLGRELVSELRDKSKHVVKFSKFELKEKIEYYSSLIIDHV